MTKQPSTACHKLLDAESPWRALESRTVQIQYALTRLQRELPRAAPLLDVTLEHLPALRRELQDLETWIATNTARVKQDAAYDYALLQPEIVEAKTMAQVLTDENCELRKRLATLSGEAKLAAEARHRQQSRCGELHLKMHELREHLQMAQANVMRLETALEAKAHDFDVAKDRINQLENRLEDLHDLEERVFQLQANLDDARDRATDAEADVDCLRTQLDQQRSRSGGSVEGAVGDSAPICELVERIDGLQANLEDARDRATDAEAECDSLRKQLDQMRAKPVESAERTDGDSARLDELEDRIAELQAHLEDARDRATDAEVDCDSLRKQLDQAHAQSGGFGEGAVGGTAQISKFEDRIVELQANLKDATERATSAEADCDALRKQLDEARARSGSSGDGVAGSVAQISELEERMAELQANLEDARDRATDAEVECDSLRKQLDQARCFSFGEGNAADSVQRRELEERVAELQANLEDARDRATDAEATCDSLRRQLDQSHA